MKFCCGVYLSWFVENNVGKLREGFCRIIWEGWDLRGKGECFGVVF